MTLSLAQYQHLCDKVLIQLIQQRDMAAFEIFYDRYAGVIYKLLKQMIRNEGSAEDLLQETFWQVWQKAEQYEGSGPVPAWLLRIARNKALDELRRQQRAQQHIYSASHEDLEQRAGPNTSQLEQQLEVDWSHQAVRSALERVPAEQRHCLELAFFHGLSHMEIAQQTNIPLGTIKTRVRSGLSKVQRLLQAIGYIPTEWSLHQASH